MIDIHAHILPGIDDGAEDLYDTLEMAQMAVDSGVDKIIATPHCNIPGMYGNYFGKEYIDKYESVVRAIREYSNRDTSGNGSIFNRRSAGSDRGSQDHAAESEQIYIDGIFV